MKSIQDKLYYYAPPVQALLLWQSLALFWFCGLLAAKYPLMGVTAMGVFVCIDSRLWRLSMLAMASALFILGMLAIMLSMPKRPPIPAWTVKGAVPVSIFLQGEVIHVQSLPDARLRIFLKNVHAVEHPEEQKLSGLLVWTWDQKNFAKEKILGPRPLPGQSVRVLAKVRSTEGYRNRWGSDFGAYWQNQEVFWRIWTRDAQGKPEIFGQATFFAKAREYIRQKLFSLVFAPSFYTGTGEKTPQHLQHLQGHQNGQGHQDWQDRQKTQQQPLQQQGRAFLPALLMYERFGLSEQTMEHMRAASLVHSLALSGQHLWLAVYYAALFVFCFRHVFPRIFVYLPKMKFLGLVCLPLALLYLWIGNAPPSLIRAALMLGLGLFFYWRMHVITLGQVLLCAALCITVYAPLSFYNLGLQLSVLCVGSICLLMPLIRRLSRVDKKEKERMTFSVLTRCAYSIGRGALGIFCISLGIQGALLPLFLTYFPPSGLWFFSNVLWLPILAYWVLPLGAFGMICAVISYTGIASFLLEVAAWPCTALLHGLAWMQEHGLFAFSAVLRPSWTTVLAWIPLCLALALLIGRVSWHDICRKSDSTVKNTNALPAIIKRLTILAACLLCIGPVQRYLTHFSDTLCLELMDVGQGQAVQIVLPGGQRFLIDGGGSFSSRFDPGTDLVLPSLLYNASPRLWAMMNTHPDVDHLRGLVHMLPLVEVERFYTNGQNFSKKDTKLWHEYGKRRFLPKRQALYAGMELSLPVLGVQDIFLEVLWPTQKTELTDNAASLVLRLVQGQGVERVGIALLCGDAEKETLQALLDLGVDISAKVLILPHHGAKDSLLPEFYEKVKPEMAFVSAGRQNAFGHPHARVVQTLQKMQIPLYSTAKNGAIQFFWQRKTRSFYRNSVLP